MFVSEQGSSGPVPVTCRKSRPPICFTKNMNILINALACSLLTITNFHTNNAALFFWKLLFYAMFNLFPSLNSSLDTLAPSSGLIHVNLKPTPSQAKNLRANIPTMFFMWRGA